MKSCFKCGATKALTDFYAHSRMADGYLNKCKDCARLDVKTNRGEKIEKYRLYDSNRASAPHRVAARASYAKTEHGKEKRREYEAKRRADKTDAVRAIQRAYYERNRARCIESSKNWARKNVDRARAGKAALQMKREAQKRRQTPRWLSAEQITQMREVYMLARTLTVSTGIQHHVDHIVPLRGRTARGLHVPWNLQILTATENVRKHNKLIDGVPF